MFFDDLHEVFPDVLEALFNAGKGIDRDDVLLNVCILHAGSIGIRQYPAEINGTCPHFGIRDVR